MLEKCKGIVLQTIPYSENSLVLKCYTDAYGLQSYMVNGIRGKSAIVKPSYLQTLTLLDLEVYHQQNKNLQRIKEIKCLPILQSLHFNPYKRTVVMFVAELLGKIVREESQPDAQLFAFLHTAIQMADVSEGKLVNFPAYFMVHLSKYLGFFPKDNFNELATDFSLQEGVFIANAPNTKDYCKGEIAKELYQILNLTLAEALNDTIQLKYRKILLDKMLRYYQLHLLLFGELKSPQILHDVFAD
jgi:DNA repair protein RecO (recombination protein O)